MPPKNTADVDSDNETSKDTCVWTTAEEAALIAELRNHRDKQTGSGFRTVVWQAVARMLKEKFSDSTGAVKTPDKCSSKYQKLKKVYKTLYTLSDKSGWGWDNAKNTIKVDDGVWDTYVASHPKHKQYRSKTFVHFADLADLMGDKFATGRGVVLVGATDAASTPRSSRDATLDGDDGAGDTGDERDGDSAAGPGEDEPVAGNKRKAAEELPNPKLKTPRTRASGAGALFAVSDAITSVASALADTPASGASTGVEPSPVRRARAIKSAQQEKEFLGKKTTVGAIKLFTKSTTAVDTFNALTDRELRKDWLESELEDM